MSPQIHITQYADSVASHLAKILDSDKHSDVISSAKYGRRRKRSGVAENATTQKAPRCINRVPPPCRFLCGTVNDFVAEVGKAYERATENKEEADAMAKKVIAGVRLM